MLGPSLALVAFLVGMHSADVLLGWVDRRRIPGPALRHAFHCERERCPDPLHVTARRYLYARSPR